MRDNWKKDVDIVELVRDIYNKLHIPIISIAGICKMSEKEIKRMINKGEQPVFARKMFMLNELEEYYKELHKEQIGV